MLMLPTVQGPGNTQLCKGQAGAILFAYQTHWYMYIVPAIIIINNHVLTILSRFLSDHNLEPGFKLEILRDIGNSGELSSFCT